MRATDVDVLPEDRDLLRRDGYWVVRSPSNPQHYWGNLLIFDRPPVVGDGERWEALFRCELPGLEHRTYAWDRTDGELGAAATEFPDFEVDRTVGLVAGPDALRAHARANGAVVVRTLELDDAAWSEVLALWEANNATWPEPHPAAHYRSYAKARIAELQGLIADGRGAWFVALDDGQVVGSLGVIITEGRARYQSVDTRASHRGRGIASRLVVDAAERVAGRWDVHAFVIAADRDYHALGIYESLGFVATEQVSGVCRWAARGD